MSVKREHVRALQTRLRCGGTAICAFLAILVTTVAADAQTVRTVQSFNGTNGEFPQYVVLVQGRDGTLYGTAAFGGDNGMGTIFRQRPTGNGNVVLHSFAGPDGDQPGGGLTLASDGNYYGTTEGGGSNSTGVLFKITSAGVLTVLHGFNGGTDGAYPVAPPIEAIDRNFYGTTSGGGIQDPTIYKLTRTGTFSIIFTLSQTQGTFLFSPLLQATDGNLFAVSGGGGANGCGSIIKLSTAGVLLTEHSFNCTSEGSIPNDLLQAQDGTIYGTTQAGGSHGNGVVYKLDTKGAFTVLYNFGGTLTDGLNPNGGLKLGNDGNLYSSTQNGGTTGGGTLFKITPAGAYTQLYSFPQVNGSTEAPLAAPVQQTGGLFYGVTTAGGTNGLGSIYRLDMGLGRFLTFVRPTGAVGQTAQILGTGLTGTTGVTFNGIAATSFTVQSDTYMTAVVPNGAATGAVVVTTPGGNLTSNVNFRILQ